MDGKSPCSIGRSTTNRENHLRMDVKKLGKYGEILNMSLVSIILYCMYYPPVINIAMENGQFIDVV